MKANIISIAYHEAGHAAVNMYYQHRIVSVSLELKSEIIGQVEVPFKRPKLNLHRNQKHKSKLIAHFKNGHDMEYVQGIMAGDLAQNKAPNFLKEIGPSWEVSSDSDKFKEKNLIVRWCNDCDYGPEFQAMFKWLQMRTKSILKTVWPAVETIANELLAKGKISGKEAYYLYEWAMSREEDRREKKLAILMNKIKNKELIDGL
ncbi:MAG: hypothetical protein ABII93_07735 [Chrysiogenia bacterium]